MVKLSTHVQPKIGEKRVVEKFAWFPSAVFKNNTDYDMVWLQKYRQYQIWKRFKTVDKFLISVTREDWVTMREEIIPS
jgi:hypothetical protein